MVTAKDSQTCQQFFAWNLPNLDDMALPQQLEQNNSLPCFPPPKYGLTANVAFPGQPASDLLGLNTGQPNPAAGFKRPSPYWNISYPTGDPCLKDSQCAVLHRLGVSEKPIDAPCAPQKGFIIFDQSGNHTRLFFSPSFSPQNQIIASNTPANTNGLCEKLASRVDEQLLVKPLVEEKWDENHLSDGEGEMLEDTEEINALLYSDSDDEYDDDGDDDADGENDEVTSTRHTPSSIEKGYEKDILPEELVEEVASSDGSPKRQRLLDDRHQKSSLVSIESPAKLASYCSYKDDVESSYAGARSSYDGIDSIKREKKVKIREALKILESIIPGLKSKDPLSIIENAILYLESMKIEAEALGLSCPEGKSVTSPP